MSSKSVPEGEPVAYAYEVKNDFGNWCSMLTSHKPSARYEHRGLSPLYPASLVSTLSTELSQAREEIERLRKENNKTRAKLMNLADATEVSGMSWNGFNIIGDAKSIKEVKRLENRSSQLEVYTKAYEERIAIEKSQAQAAARELEEARAAKVKPLVWIEAPNGRLDAQSMVGVYSIFEFAGSYVHLALHSERAVHLTVPYHHKRIEEAKAAAQADYESRILSALSIPEQRKK